MFEKKLKRVILRLLFTIITLIIQWRLFLHIVVADDNRRVFSVVIGRVIAEELLVFLIVITTETECTRTAISLLPDVLGLHAIW